MQAFALAPRLQVLRRAHTSNRTVVRPPRHSIPLAAIAQPRATLTPDTPSPASMPASPPPPSLEEISPSDRSRIEDVRQQLEFWFSASNLRRDWYLRRQMDDEGWLDPAVFLLFNRIKRLNASLEDIILAARFSDELEVSIPSPASFGDSAAQTRLRRSSTLPDFREWDDEEVERSFIVKNLPPDSTVDSLMTVFSSLAPVSYLRIYRGKSDDQPPRALVCFNDKPTADAVFAAFSAGAPSAARGMVIRRRRVQPGSPASQMTAGAPPVSISAPESRLGGVIELTPRSNTLVFRIDSLPNHVDWKLLYKHIGNILLARAGATMRFLLFTPGETTAHVTVLESPAVYDMLSELSESGLDIEDSVASVRLLEDPEEIAAYWTQATQHEADRRRRRAEREAVESSTTRGQPSGVVVKLSGLPENLRWQSIKSDLIQLGKIVYINFSRGGDNCHVRFASAEEASYVIEKLTDETDPTLVGNTIVGAELLTGVEEEEYWERAKEVGRIRRAKQGETKSEDVRYEGNMTAQSQSDGAAGNESEGLEASSEYAGSDNTEAKSSYEEESS